MISDPSPPDPQEPPNHQTNARLLDFALRQPVDDKLVNLCILGLPLPSALFPLLRKSILLRRLTTQLSNNSISDRTLHSLELIAELDLAAGLTPSAPIQLAYRSVAVECTTSSLRDPGGDFPDAVDRIWKCRLADLEQSESASLAEASKDSRNMMEEALTSDAARAALLKRDTLKEALDSLRAYLNHANTPDKGKECATVYRLEAFSKFDHLLNLVTTSAEVAASGLSRSLDAQGRRAIYKQIDGYEPEGVQSNIEQHDQNQNEHVSVSEMSAEIVCSRSSDRGVMHGTGEISEQLSRLVDIEPPDPKESEGNQDNVAANLNEKYVSVGAKATGFPQPPTLMERNPIAHTFEWNDDSTDRPSERSPIPLKKRRLPSFRTRDISPPKLSESRMLNQHRKRRKWSVMEEDTLRDAVKRKKLYKEGKRRRKSYLILIKGPKARR